ncbi:50S ribosomal protein L13 [Pontibacter sp. 172403-2]|uniref:50S ribosomal protein L13 n=1 Tax=Pontibacter rufus TaxID=2791028 RepID=UPI0018AF9137|nr:50S ribosomal protein L13 [Pontibacter sp. 172403-2]MBF9253334.1 50S ribosomal protein L13 [Pontibacter sp. 172403-2]
MDHLSYKTQFVNKKSANKGWVIVDAGQGNLGRVASEVAKILKGKNKPTYTPFADCGDNVIVINADNVRFSGRKWDQKYYLSHTGYPGGQRRISPRELKAKSSTLLVEHAVRGMLPKGVLGRELFRNLHVFTGSEHPYAAQQPKELTLNI